MGRKLLVLIALIAVACCPATAQDLVLNPSFEIDPVENAQAPGWAQYTSGDGIATWLKGPPDWSPGNDDSPWVAAVGTWLPGQWAFWSQSFPAVPGQTVEFSYWSYSYPEFNGTTVPKLEFYAANQEGGAMAISTVSGDPITGLHIWTPRTVTATVPQGAVRVRAMMWVDSAASEPASGSSKFDNASLTSPQAPTLVTPGQAKGLADNTLVWLKWPVVVKDNGSDTAHTDVYVTGYGREGTIRVTSSSPFLSNNVATKVEVGAMLHVVGVVATVSGEKVVQASDLVVTNWDGPWPKPYISNTKGVAQISHSSGQVFTVTGNVSEVDAENGWFYIDDGSGVTGEGGSAGIKVYHDVPAEDFPALDSVISVTGLAWREIVGEDSYPTLTTRGVNDITVHKAGTGPGANLLLNPGFEQGLSPWVTSESVALEGWAALNGTRGIAFYTWDPYTEAYFYQDVTGISAGTTYQFKANIKEEVNHVGVIKLRIEWYNASDVLINPSAEITVDPPIDWGEFTLNGVAPAGAVKARFMVLDTEHVQGSGSLLAVMADDLSAKAL